MSDPSSLLHPVRLRVVQALLGAESRTTRRLHEMLPDVPIATLYRHVAHLVAHDVIEVVDERQIRGASEKAYRLRPGLENPSADHVSELSPDETLTAFTVFTSGVIRDFAAYLASGDHDLHADRVSFAQAPFWASATEVDAFGRALMEALTPLLRNEPTPDRRRRTLTTVLLPQADEHVPRAAEPGDAS